MSKPPPRNPNLKRFFLAIVHIGGFSVSIGIICPLIMGVKGLEEKASGFRLSDGPVPTVISSGVRNLV